MLLVLQGLYIPKGVPGVLSRYDKRSTERYRSARVRPQYPTELYRSVGYGLQHPPPKFTGVLGTAAIPYVPNFTGVFGTSSITVPDTSVRLIGTTSVNGAGHFGKGTIN